MDDKQKMKVVILTGLSGAGKTNAGDWFEDAGYYCVDNLPPILIDSFLELAKTSRKKIDRAAFIVDVRGGAFFDDLRDCIIRLRADEQIDCSVLFIEASASTLVKRFSETRRSHPLAKGSTTRAVIQQERERLSEIRAMADHIIDTTGMKVSELKEEIGKVFSSGAASFVINVMSFGYKHGIPDEADLVFDMRFIPNPYYVASLKKLSGNNKKVASFVLRQDITKAYITDMLALLEKLIPAYVKEGKYHLNIAFGCTGGRHRSVAMANEMTRLLRERGYRLTLEHRDL